MVRGRPPGMGINLNIHVKNFTIDKNIFSTYCEINFFTLIKHKKGEKV